MTLVRGLAVVALLHLSVPSTARADPDSHPTAVYVEGLGVGGLWGLGVEHRIHPRWGVGAVGSAGTSEDQHYASLTPYAQLDLVRSSSRRHAWFADGGAQLAHVWNDSPVPEWSGSSSTGVGATVSTGYEFRDRVLFRLFALGVVGKGGFLPWAGVDIGMTL